MNFKNFHPGKTVGSVFFVVVLLCSAGAGYSATKLDVFESPEQEQLYKELLEEYRCLKCQNQNLAGSNADLAGDLRDEIRDQVLDGKSRGEIDDYLVARYGDFVLYKPRLKPATLVLWFGPFILLAIAGWYALRVARGHRELSRIQASGEAMSEEQGTSPKAVNEARSLLDD